MSRCDLIIRNALDLKGRPLAIAIMAGRVVRMGHDLRPSKGEPELDARGATLTMGLHDHHLHLLATAAKLASVDLANAATPDEVVTCLRAAPEGGWVRAIGFDERVGGWPDAAALDHWVADRPLRMQDRTGGWWLLNSAGVAQLGRGPWPDWVERNGMGAPTGRIRRGDAWLRERIGSAPPDLGPLGQQLLRWGVTAVTDATAHNGPAEAALLAGTIPQRLTLMGSEALPAGAGYVRGPLKLLIDEDDAPPVEAIAARIALARRQGRAVAAHCVTLGELLLFLGALDAAGGARQGDRIEHGGIIPASLIADLSLARLTVVSNPGFIHDRGDRYLAEVPAQDHADLYRLETLRLGGVRLRGGSDAPYGDLNPWVAIRAAMDRRTRDGHVVGANEALRRDRAVALYGPQILAPGEPADLILFDWPEDAGTLVDVQMTMLGGEVVFSN
jgi:predicted amidohydrolase YtcJ